MYAFFFFSTERLSKALIECVSASVVKLSDGHHRLFNAAFLPRIDAMIAKIVRFTRVNLRVHYSIYNHLITAAVAQRAR